MKHEVEILCGPASAGKTSRLLAEYRGELARALSAQAPGRALWISPTERSRREVLRALVDASLPACFAPHVLTFDAFAERVLAAEGGAVRPLSAIARRMLASSVIDSARRSHVLEYFQPIAHTSGFLDLVLSFFSELKREELWPEDFARIAERRGSRKDRELAGLYGAYQRRLVDARLYDTEGRFWSARSILASGGGPFRELSLVVVDGFADFTHTQYEILALLAERAERMAVSLQMDSPAVRTDLFAKSAAALDAIRELVERVHVAELPRSAHAVPALRHVCEAVFDNPRSVIRRDDARGIEVLAAAGPAGEVRMVAERIKRLLLGRARPDEIVVAVRGLEEYADLIDGTFSSAGIPFGCDVRPQLSSAPIVKTVSALLENEREDWPFARLAALLRSSYFRPAWARLAEPASVAATIGRLRTCGVGEGRVRMLAAAARKAQAAEPARQAEAVRSSELLSRLSAATDRLRETLPFESWVERLIGVCDELGVSPRPKPPGAAVDELDRRDARHWECLKETLYDAVEILRKVEDRPELALDGFCDVLRDLLHAQALPSSPILPGRVPVIEASDVRNLDAPHLFLCGLSESSFPQRRQDDCVSSQSERRQLARSRKSGQKRSTHQQDEMQLFYSIVTRARSSLTLSYPALSGSGQPLFPSPYLEAVRDLFEPEAIPVTTRNDLDPVPTIEHALTAADLRLLATDQVRKGDAGFLRAVCEQRETAAAGRTMLAAAEMAAARFETSGFTTYEGLLTRPETLVQLGESFSSKHEFSATGLEAYAVCPFRFLLHDLLRVEPPVDPDDRSTALARGKLLHRLLKRLHESAGQKGGDADLAAGFRKLVLDVLPDDAAHEVIDEALLHIEREFFSDLADVYSEQWAAYCEKHKDHWEAPPKPAFLEIAFGKAPDEGEDHAAQRFAAIEIGQGKSKIKVGGRIDRVDVGRAAGRPVFNVIDYKTSFAPNFKIDQVHEGTALQLAIYMLVVARHELAGEGAEAFQIAYWTLTRDGFLPGLKGGPRAPRLGADAIAEIEKVVTELLPRMAARMRTGEFPVRNNDEDCGGRCDYHTICRVNQVRAMEEARAKLWRLAAE